MECEDVFHSYGFNRDQIVKELAAPSTSIAVPWARTAGAIAALNISRYLKNIQELFCVFPVATTSPGGAVAAKF